MRSRRSARGAAFLAILAVAIGTPSASAEVGHARAWVSVFGNRQIEESAYQLTVSPDGARVYAPMSESGTATSFTAGLVAYSTATGARLWNARQGIDRRTVFEGVAVDSTGARVFAVGGSYHDGATAPRHALVAAYDATTGAREWVVTTPIRVVGFSAVVSPDGSTLYMSGGAATNADRPSQSVIAAYDTATGALRWSHHVSDHGAGFGNPARMQMSPDGSTLFVAAAGGFPSAEYMTTVALSTVDGSVRWNRTFAPRGASGAALAIAVSPDGATLVVTGWVGPQTTTVAYDTATGARRWVAQYVEGSNAWAVTMSPDGQTVYVAGQQDGDSDHSTEEFTAAYDMNTGDQRWVDVGTGTAGDGPSLGLALVVTPDGASVATVGNFYVDNSRWVLVTHVLGAADGHDEWTAEYRPALPDESEATDVRVTPDGTRLLVAGDVWRPGGDIRTVFLAYDL